MPQESVNYYEALLLGKKGEVEKRSQIWRLCLFFSDYFGAGGDVFSLGYPVDGFFVSEQIGNVYCVFFWWEPIYVVPVSVNFVVEDNPWALLFSVISKHIVFDHVDLVDHLFHQSLGLGCFFFAHWLFSCSEESSVCCKVDVDWFFVA
jgi:hypothetical protein